MYCADASMTINGVSTTLPSGTEMVVKSEDIIYQLEMKDSAGTFDTTPSDYYLTLNAKDKITFRLTLKYDPSASSVSASDKALAVSATFPFTQA